mmetsp:Transcript_8032/g.29687  ORF Transcript_8032/g.29687 Transcript_8032/m.29687 type:complete len:210 (+) Transcript_8032:2324-2953(+)
MMMQTASSSGSWHTKGGRMLYWWLWWEHFWELWDCSMRCVWEYCMQDSRAGLSVDGSTRYIFYYSIYSIHTKCTAHSQPDHYTCDTTWKTYLPYRTSPSSDTSPSSVLLLRLCRLRSPSESESRSSRRSFFRLLCSFLLFLSRSSSESSESSPWCDLLRCFFSFLLLLSSSSSLLRSLFLSFLSLLSLSRSRWRSLSLSRLRSRLRSER